MDEVINIKVANNRNEYRTLARLFKALGNEARLVIVQNLLISELSVGELTELVGLDPSTVSKHLSVLRTSGLVDDRRDGNMVYYHVLTPCIANFFSCAIQVQNERKRST